MTLSGFHLPNPDFGYKTTIQMPLHFVETTDGRLSVYAEPEKYDTFSVRCNLSVPKKDVRAFNAFYTIGYRGSTVLLEDCAAFGFYPFTPALVSSINGVHDTYHVILDRVEAKGSPDIFGRSYDYQFDLRLLYEDLVYAPLLNFKPTGAFSIIGPNVRLDGLRYPYDGFSPRRDTGVYNYPMLGGYVEIIDYTYLRMRSRLDDKFSITADYQTAVSLLRTLLIDIRHNVFNIEGPDNYRLFAGINPPPYKVRLNTPTITVTHVRFNEFKIDFSVTEVRHV